MDDLKGLTDDKLRIEGPDEATYSIRNGELGVIREQINDKQNDDRHGVYQTRLDENAYDPRQACLLVLTTGGCLLNGPYTVDDECCESRQ